MCPACAKALASVPVDEREAKKVVFCVTPYLPVRCLALGMPSRRMGAPTAYQMDKGIVLEFNDLTRRQALKLMMAAATLAALTPSVAAADTASDLAQTEADLNNAQAQVEQAQAQLDQIARDYQALAEEQSKTLAQIEGKQGEIDDTQRQIDRKQKELEEKQARLAKRLSSSYKHGDENILSIILNSTSLEDLASSIYYLGKISDSDRRMIEEVKTVKEELAQKKDELEGQKAELEALSQTQQQQMQAMQAKQEEVNATLAGLSDQVKQLMAQRDDQLEQMAQEKAAQEAEAERRRTSSRGGSSGSSGNDGTTGTVSSNGSLTGAQQRVINCCHSTPTPGRGLCAMWVSRVFANAGYAYASGNANDMYNAWCTSSNKGYLQPGMVIAVSTHRHTTAGRIYGHIGIYIGNGMVMQNVGSITTQSLNDWIAYYGTTVTPRWGWLMGISLR